MDDYFHGTFCAGIIGSVGNNHEGGAGVAWRVQLMATKGLNRKGGGDLADLMPGTRYAADNGARVSNNSCGSTNPNKNQLAQFNDGIGYARDKGMLFVAAAGNESGDNDVDGPRQIFPASLRLPNMISVAASTSDDQLASVSNYGQTSVDLAAPGELVGSTVPLIVDPAFPYQLGTGTSLAAPHVAGAAALMLARNPGLSYGQLKEAILTSADPVPALAGKTVTGGRLNLYRALASVPAAGAAAATAPVAADTFSSVRTPTGRDLLTTGDPVLG
jgi:subtilisin family serine protease